MITAVLVATFGRNGLRVLPYLCLLITILSITRGVHVSVVTYYRLDEVLAGCCLALLYCNGSKVMDTLSKRFLNSYMLLVLLIISSHPESGPINYLRPYFAALLIGSTLVNKNSMLVSFLQLKIFVYIATISYALYVIHGGLRHTWLGDGDTLEKYLKRPLLFAVTFFLAHISTFYYEKKCVNWGRVFAKRLNSRFQTKKIVENREKL